MTVTISWHSLAAEEVLVHLGSSERGLTVEEAGKRLKADGPNTLPESKPRPVWLLFLTQFQSPLIYLLIAAAGVVFALGETTDAYIILAILVFNAVVGAIQEGRAQSTLRALRRFVETRATVLREGETFFIPDREVVRGDVLLIEAGEKVPADARIVSSKNLKVDEATLTGESGPVGKSAESGREGIPIAERRNMVFMGTHIVAGSARAVAVATGVRTEVGAIAQRIRDIDTEIPLRVEIRTLANTIIKVVILGGACLFAIGLVAGHTVREMVATVVSLSVSVIPEGLPIVITLVLATGVWQMSKRNVLVKRLQAVEALGQASVIAVDKTGTLTRNELVIRAALAGGERFTIEGDGYTPTGRVLANGKPVDLVEHPTFRTMVESVARTGGARASYDEAAKRWRIAGDPTEAAMVVLGEKLGLRKDDLERASPLLEEVPFDHALKYHATVHKVEGEAYLSVTGAPETVIPLCTDMEREGSVSPLSAKDADELREVLLEMSKKGLRVIAVAMRRGVTDASPGAMGGLTFLGYLGMEDTLRPEVAGALKAARDARIKVVMITGDHVETARAIAREAGIYQNGNQILTGSEVEEMFDTELAKALENTVVFARVSPEHKLRIVQAYKSRGDIVAMTGDGVNDAPPLVAADLGVAMGGIGTEVAKEAADIVLLDDNFGSIVAAVEEGRSIYKTVKKVILYLFSTSIGEALTIIGALLISFPLPLLPAHIIWLNFVTDGFLDVALAMEPKERGLLREKRQRGRRRLVDRTMMWRMAVMATPMAIGTLALYSLYADIPEKAWTVSLTTLAVFQWFNAWNCRSDRESVFFMNPFSNLFLVAATGFVMLLQLAAVYTPLLQGILRTVPLTLDDWLLIVPVASSIILVEELRKLIVRIADRSPLLHADILSVVHDKRRRDT